MTQDSGFKNPGGDYTNLLLRGGQEQEPWKIHYGRNKHKHLLIQFSFRALTIGEDEGDGTYSKEDHRIEWKIDWGRGLDLDRVQVLELVQVGDQWNHYPFRKHKRNLSLDKPSRKSFPTYTPEEEYQYLQYTLAFPYWFNRNTNRAREDEDIEIATLNQWHPDNSNMVPPCMIDKKAHVGIQDTDGAQVDLLLEVKRKLPPPPPRPGETLKTDEKKT